MNKFLFGCLSILCFLTSCSDTTIDSPESSLLAMVLVDGKYGYINTANEFVIEPQYPLARTFSNGVACINEGGNRDNGLVQGVLGGTYYFINIDNKKQFNGFSSSSPMSFYNEVAVIEEDDQTKSLLNKEGKKIAEGFSVLGDCTNDLIPAAIEKTKKIGFINSKGEWKIELPYKYFITPFHEQMSAFTDTETKLSGYFNTAGEIAIPAIFQSNGNFSEGLARVKQDLTYFFIDKSGKKAFDKEFENAGDFKNGLCPVKKEGKWGFIDRTGKLIIAYQNVSGVREYSNDRIAFKNDKGVGYMNGKGDIVIKPQFDNGLSFKNGYAIIEKNGKIGFIDTNGKVIIEPQYTRAGNFVDPNISNKIFKEN